MCVEDMLQCFVKTDKVMQKMFNNQLITHCYRQSAQNKKVTETSTDVLPPPRYELAAELPVSSAGLLPLCLLLMW